MKTLELMNLLDWLSYFFSSFNSALLSLVSLLHSPQSSVSVCVRIASACLLAYSFLAVHSRVSPRSGMTARLTCSGGMGLTIDTRF